MCTCLVHEPKWKGDRYIIQKRIRNGIKIEFKEFAYCSRRERKLGIRELKWSGSNLNSEKRRRISKYELHRRIHRHQAGGHPWKICPRLDHELVKQNALPKLILELH